MTVVFQMLYCGIGTMYLSLIIGDTSCIVGAVTHKDMAKKLSAYLVSSCGLAVGLAFLSPW